jgi:hypothetical protein
MVNLMGNSNKDGRRSWGGSCTPRTAPPETEADRNAAKIAALVGGHVVADNPWVYFAGLSGEDLARCDDGEYIALEIRVTCDEACALLARLRELRGLK